jgi:hypothetical protein
MVDRNASLDNLAMRILEEKPMYVQKRYEIVQEESQFSLREVLDKAEMAMITSAIYGVTDRGVLLGIDIMINASVGTSSYLGEEATKFIEDYDVKDVKDLVGKPISVIQYKNVIMWLEPLKIKLKR